MKSNLLKRNWEFIALAGALSMTVCAGALIYVDPMAAAHQASREGVAVATSGSTASNNRTPDGLTSAANYAVIGNRNLLAGSATSGGDEATGEEESSQEVPAVTIRTMDSARPDPASDMIAPVGIVAVEGEPLVMLEDGRRGETTFVGVGQSAFGYRVRAIEGDQVKLERDGREFQLELGDNKPETRRGGAIVRNPETLGQLPLNLQQSVLGMLPAGSELRRVRMGNENGQMVYRVSATQDGRDTDLRLTPDGQVLRKDTEVTFNDVPPGVVESAARALPGYSVNPRNPPTIRERGGQRTYEIEVRSPEGRQIDLILAPDGSVIGRD